MAAINWKSVAAPDLSGEVGAIQSAGEQLTAGFGQLGNVIKQAKTADDKAVDVRTATNTDLLTQSFDKVGSSREVNDMLAGALSAEGIRGKYGAEADIGRIQAAGKAKLVDLEQKAGTSMVNDAIKQIGGTDMSLPEILANVTKQSAAQGYSPKTQGDARARIEEVFNAAMTPSFKQQRDLDQTAATGAAEIKSLEADQSERDRLFTTNNVDTFADIRAPGASGAGQAIKDTGTEDFFNWSNTVGAGGEELRDLFNDYKEKHPGVEYWKIQAAIRDNPVTDSAGMFSGGFSIDAMERAVADITIRENSYQALKTKHVNERRKKLGDIEGKRGKLQSALNKKTDSIRQMSRKFLKQTP